MILITDEGSGGANDWIIPCLLSCPAVRVQPTYLVGELHTSVIPIPIHCKLHAARTTTPTGGGQSEEARRGQRRGYEFVRHDL